MCRRKGLFLVIALQFAFALAANACPQCRYSPNNWGFCRYGAYAGPYDCKEYVQDPWTGRTNCHTCGYCNWGAPSANVPCSAGIGGDPDCGISTPCDQSLNAPADSCRSPRISGNNAYSWMGTRTDQVAIF